MNNPLISIIIPSFNRDLLIVETLDSILTQTYQNWECIVVDDGSEDDTEEVVKNYVNKDPRFTFFHRPNQREKGPCACRNFGFENCNGEYIIFLDSDDLLKLDALSTMVDVTNKNHDAIVAQIELVDFKTQTIKKTYPIQSSNLLQDFFLGTINFFVCGPMWNKSFLNRQDQLFDESIRNGDDWDFNLRMLYQEPSLKFLDYVSTEIRLHRNSLSKERLNFNAQEIKSYFKSIDIHLDKIKRFEHIDKKIVYNFVINKYRSFLLMALEKQDSFHFILFLRLLGLEFSQYNFANSIKLILGYTSFLFFNKGYRLISNKH
jgi:glycosyltransferase involved in cell wall biosynthesis